MYAAVSLALILTLAVGFGRASEESFSYQYQGNWTGVCTTGSRQSPVNIVTSAVTSNSSLTGLDFNSAWTAQTSGSLKNAGSTVKFTPTAKTASFTAKFLGTYLLQQFHMHWGGPGTGTGSEHRINNEQAELEIHFVHYKQGTADSSLGDYAAVVAVLADVVDVPISGIWSKLNIPAIQSNTSSPLSITGLVFNDLLPANRSYYYYMGSLTTQPCSEIVQWFVLKDRISVPSAFLNNLRMVQERDGAVLLTNYRDAQPLNSRVVMEGSQSFLKPAMLVVFITVLLTKLI